jgi:hypothetical protein
MEQTKQFGTNHRAKQFLDQFALEQSLKSKGNAYACRDSQRRLEQASDRFHRANRDLGETAGLLAASLTTVTAVEAVINIAVERIGLAPEILKMAFDGYIGLLIGILFVGTLRFVYVMGKRAQAEKEIDKAKKGILDFCPVDQWPKHEE